MADFEVENIENLENETMSLYEMCLNVISCEFGSIDRKYVKDLPKHILEQILCRLNPYDLETLENEEFLNLRGISTDSLWKLHFTSRFKHAARLPILNFHHFTWTSWRTQYFERHFHVVVHKIALTSEKKIEKSFQDDLNKELFKQPQGTRLSKISPPDMNDVLDLCIKHLTRFRVRHNTTCVYLGQRPDILTKLAPVLEHVEMGQLQDHSVEALIRILDVLLKNKLKSFLLSNCKVDNVERLRALLKTLAKSQSLDTQSKLSVEFKEDDITTVHDYRKYSEGAGLTKEYNTEEYTGLKSGSIFDENLQEHSNCNEMIDNKDFCSSTSKCDTSSFNSGTDMINDCLYNDLDVHKEGNTLIYTLESDNSSIRVSQDDQEKHADDNCSRTEDDLYEDIFSRQTTLQDACQENDAATTRIDSSPMRKPWGMERKLEVTSNQLYPHCLTELKLSSCLVDNTSLKVFSEELVFFLSLRSLALCDVGLCSFPAMNDLITNINELVIHGSLRRLVFENESLTFLHMEMFCDMLILSCERCQLTQAHKGLWWLRLMGGILLNMDRFGEVLRTCSFCEERVSAHRRTSGIWFKTKDNTFHSACKCLNKGVLKSCGNSGLLPKNVDCNLPKQPVACNQETKEAQVINYEPDVQPNFVNSVQNNLMRRRDTVSSKHQHITSGIESLYFSFHNICHASATVLASSLLRNRSVRSISLPSCGLKTEDISNIFDCISGGDFHEVNTAVEKLDLRDNLFEVIQNNSLCNLITRSHLVYLDLSYCGLEVIPDGVVLALSSNKFLQVFMIAGNRLGDAGVIQLSKVFTSAKKTSVLNTLGLSCNRLTSCSLLHLGNVLLTTWPTKLREISLCENPLVESTFVRECLQKVFNVVIIEPVVDGVMAYADYLSEM